MNIVVNLKAFKRLLKGETRRARYVIKYLLEKKKEPSQNLFELGKLYEGSPLSVKGNYPTQILTPQHVNCMTTFFDVEPISPCGNFLLVTIVPILERIPFPGDLAQVCVIDIRTGDYRAVYNTLGWGAQLGANVQWGENSGVVFCNDLIHEQAKGIKIDVDSLEVSELDGPIYSLTQDKSYSYGANLKLINALIPGYGVPEPVIGRHRQTENVSENEGIWKTNLTDGSTQLFMSIKDIVEQVRYQEKIDGGTYYIFNVKVNKQHSKLLVVLFAKSVNKRIGFVLQLLTIDLISKAVKLVVRDAEWSKGGHHPNWVDDGEHILMNLKLNGKVMRFVKINANTGDKEILSSEFVGGGHPSFSKTGRYILTDAYTSEGLTDSDGNVPIRLIDLKNDEETVISKVYTKRLDGPCRIDPHPVWSSHSNRVIWNGVSENKRQVFCADLTNLAE